MITEDMLDFVRAQRAGGMTDAELAQLLITEGGWNQDDVDEAFRALSAPLIMPSAPLLPPALASTFPTLETPVVTPKVFPADPYARPPESSIPTLDARTTAGVVLQGLPPGQPLAGPKLAHEQFLGLFSDKGSQPKEQRETASPISSSPRASNATEDSRKIFLHADSLASAPPSVPLPTFSPPTIKKSTQFSLEGLLSTKGQTPPPAAVQAEAVFSPPAVSLPSKSVSAAPARITFDLSSALRGAGQKELTRPVSLNDLQGKSSGEAAPILPAALGVTPVSKVEPHATASDASDKSIAPPSLGMPTERVAQIPSGLASQPVSPPQVEKEQKEKKEGPALPQDGNRAQAEQSSYDGNRAQAEQSSYDGNRTQAEQSSQDGNRAEVEQSSHDDKEKKKIFSGTRTMSADLLRGTAKAPPSPPAQKTESASRTLDRASNETTAPSAALNPLRGSTTALGSPDTFRGEQSAGQTVLAAPSAVSPLFPDELSQHRKTKRLLIAAGIVLLLALCGGGIYAYMKFRSPNSEAFLQTAFTQFFTASSFAYKGEATADLTLTGITNRGGKDGKIQFSFDYSGTLANSKEGYGDGTHKITFDGGWQSGTSTFVTAITSDVLVVGNDFYFNILSIPKESELDPELLRANWIKMNLADIARELQISGVAQGEEEYGSFGGTTGETSLNALLERTLPLRAVAKPVKEELNGVAVSRVHVVVDPDRFTEFLRALHRRYMNRDLTFSEEELLRFKGALAKLEGDVWADRETGALLRIVLRGTFDDDIGDVHAKGPVTLEFAFSDFNKPPLFGTPSPVLSLTEFRTKMEESAQLKEARARDEVRLSHLTLLSEALALYRAEKGRYPKELTELYAAKKITSASIDLATLKDYLYRSYLKLGVYTKAGACLTTGKVCAFYHLGTNLLDPTNNALQSDADLTTAILGADSTGCGGEKNVACYDIVSPAPATTAATSPAPATPATP